jgi:hypothetical protein
VAIEIAINSTRAWLEACAQAGHSNAERSGAPVPYTSTADLLLRHGRAYEWYRFPRRLARGLPRQCYLNASRLALRSSRFTYVEGCAIGCSLGIPVEHAWCIDAEGRVVDPTWKDGHDYFGVAFRTTYLRFILSLNRNGGLITNHKMGFPLLTGKHRVEEALA